MFTKLRTRLTVIFVILTLIPVLATAYTLGSNSYTQAVNSSLQNQRLVNSRAVQAISDTLDTHVGELTLLGNTNNLALLSDANLRGVISPLLRQQSYKTISVLTPSGQEKTRMGLFANGTEATARNYTQDALFLRVVKTGKVGYSDVHFDDQTGEPLLTMAVPFFDTRTGELSSVIYADFRFQEIWNLLGDLKGQSGQSDLQLFLTDAAGKIVAHTNSTIAVQKRSFEVPSSDGQAIGLDGDQVLLTSQNYSLANLDFTVVATQSTSVALQSATDTARSTIIITLITILIAGAVIVSVTGQIVRPIEQLSSVAQAIRDGDLNAQANIVRSDEIGKMAQAFNSMTAKLRTTLEGLKQHVDELETARADRERMIRELREVSRLKSEFLSTMSHELRTPLNAMIGFTELMMAGVSGVLTDKQKHQLGRIHANSLRLLSLIDDVLDLSRIEAGRVDIENAPFSPRDMATKVETQMSSLAEKKGLQLIVTVDDALPQNILGDQARIEHIAINLLSNAFKFTEKGEVELSLKPTDDKQDWTLSVRDTGIGIPAHAQEYIFEEFRQVDGSSRRVYGGSGLGLAICRNLSRLMGGDVRLQSTLGQGSTFTLTLPLHAAKESTTPELVAVAN